MKTCRESGGTNTLYLNIKEEHDLVGTDLLCVPFEEFFAFFNQKALDKFNGLLLLFVSTISVIKSLYIARLFHCMYL